ncbi:hypothetical protein TW86_03790 [Halomonas sp. S2151]|uniref:hypothetical protein n=1 Tax=Halomonas sp. S2151 TaxID=579478 RepID=UPI0005F9D971|nr:hypothetical protein [Halomonas sp. S2151]KJZ17388.1 hypothetical protein TW86_03790 [Halomonas sp. S2151]
MAQAHDYLKTFFEEKHVPDETYTVTDQHGQAHIMSSETVIELIMQAPDQEQQQIADILRKIDFMNGKVSPFLRHLAEGFVRTQAK